MAMAECTELFQVLVHGASEITNGLKPPDTAVCLQWDAAVRAGIRQAKAARDAGHMTLAAGVSALLGALGAGYAGISSVKRQIAANRSAQERQIAAEMERGRIERDHLFKKELYIPAATALFAGLWAIVSLSDLRLRVEDAIKDFTSRSPDLARVHLAAKIETARCILLGLVSS